MTSCSSTPAQEFPCLPPFPDQYPEPGSLGATALGCQPQKGQLFLGSQNVKNWALETSQALNPNSTFMSRVSVSSPVKWKGCGDSCSTLLLTVHGAASLTMLALPADRPAFPSPPDHHFPEATDVQNPSNWNYLYHNHNSYHLFSA